ncbi:hypothetical protein ACP4OV_018695 [Aristida adscensionis]
MSSRSRLVAATSSSSSSSTKSSKNNIEQEQPHLPGAYIRSLVKHLSSSSSSARSRAGQHLMSTTMTSTIPPADHHRSPATPQRQEQEQSPPHQKPQMKKQVRRRMQTSRPYQERLLNMAEARREIVTALKIHRANMRRQQEQLQPPLLQQQQQPVQVVFQEQSRQAVYEASMAAMSYASFSTTNHLCSSPLAQLIGDAPAGSRCYSSSMLPYYLPPFDVPVAVGGMDGHGGGLEHWACSLPAQPLGLNLSFQGLGGFVDDDAKNKNSDDLIGLPLIQPSPPASCYSSAFSAPAMAVAGHGGSPAFLTAENAPVLCGPAAPDADEMHGAVEWGDTAADDVAAAPARWSEIVESAESAGGEDGAAAVVSMEDGVMACLPAELLYDGDFVVDGEQGIIVGAKAPDDVLEMRLDDGDVCCYRDDHGAAAAADDIALPLPCMADIGDIEGWEDEEWFS